MKKIIKYEAVFNTNSTINNTGFIHSGVCFGGGGGMFILTFKSKCSNVDAVGSQDISHEKEEMQV